MTGGRSPRGGRPCHLPWYTWLLTPLGGAASGLILLTLVLIALNGHPEVLLVPVAGGLVGYFVPTVMGKMLGVEDKPRPLRRWPIGSDEWFYLTYRDRYERTGDPAQLEHMLRYVPAYGEVPSA